MNKTVKFIFSLIVIALYALAVFVLMFNVANVQNTELHSNYLLFRILGFVIILLVAGISVFSDSFHIGNKAPMIMFTVIYTLAVDILSWIAVTSINNPEKVSMSTAVFSLINVVILIVYAVLVLPVIYMGMHRKNQS